MIVAVEDLLSESVVRKLVGVVRPELTIWSVIRKNGSGYLRSRIRELNRTARSVPVFLLTDQDRPVPCPADLIAAWLTVPPARCLLFRLAVMEVESWIMADRERFADFIRVSSDLIPANTDTLPRPKEFIVSLARRSRRKDIREDLVPAPGGTAAVGPGFNSRIANFVAMHWDPSNAAEASPSLQRAILRLQDAFR